MLDLPTPLPLPTNEPILNYAPGSPEKLQLKAALRTMAAERPDIPHVIGGKELRDGEKQEINVTVAERPANVAFITGSVIREALHGNG